MSERSTKTGDVAAATSLRSARRSRLAVSVMYGGIALVMILIWTETLASVLPNGVARRIAFNSEGFFFAGLLAVWIQFARPVGDERRVRIWAATAAVACLALGLSLMVTDLPSRFKTLSESFFAIAFAIPYVTVRRPVKTWVPPAPAVAVLVVAVVSMAVGDADWLVRQAEFVGLFVLLPIGLDVIDRGILDPSARTSRPLRFFWYAVLAAEVVIVSAVGTQARTSGRWYSDILDYLGRSHEAVIGVLLIQLFFAVGLGRIGASRLSRTPN